MNRETTMQHYSKKVYIFPIIILSIIMAAFITKYNYALNKALTKSENGIPIKLDIKLDNVSLDYNNSVGNDWSFTSQINNSNLKEGNNILLNVRYNDKIVIKCNAIEYDSISDHGQAMLIVNVNKINLAQKNNYSIPVIVRENRGRYSGCTAKWNFNFSVKRKVSLGEILSNFNN